MCIISPTLLYHQLPPRRLSLLFFFLLMFPLYLNCMAEFPISFGPALCLKAGGLRVPAGVVGFDLSSAWRRPASLLAPSLCGPPRLTQASRCHLAFPQRALPPLGSAEPPGGDTHTHAIPCHTLSDPSNPKSCSLHHHHHRLRRRLPSPLSPRKGVVLSGSLKPCLYCQRTSRHLPPLEHLVPSCWAWTENSTIRSPMNCCFRARA